LE
jgi:catechol 2,3-dioxygenase-like lactoylglutathione lyase family enzyme